MDENRNRPEEEPKLDPFSMAFKARKESLYDRVKLTAGQLDVVIWVTAGLLAVVVALIVLEAAGVFKL